MIVTGDPQLNTGEGEDFGLNGQEKVSEEKPFALRCKLEEGASQAWTEPVKGWKTHTKAYKLQTTVSILIESSLFYAKKITS